MDSARVHLPPGFAAAGQPRRLSLRGVGRDVASYVSTSGGCSFSDGAKVFSYSQQGGLLAIAGCELLGANSFWM